MSMESRNIASGLAVIKVSNFVRKIVISLLVVSVCVTLSACVKRGGTPTLITVSGIDMSKAKVYEDSANVMGVTYILYDNGYALIKTILRENATISDTISYENKAYSVIGLAEPEFLGMSYRSYGIFGNSQSGCQVSL